MNMEYELRRINSSKSYKNGKRYESLRGGEFTIIGQTTTHRTRIRKGKLEKEYCYFLVEFYNKYTTVASATNIKRGNIANPYHPTVYNIGYLGVGDMHCGAGDTKYKKTHEYMIWASMLQRCYDPIYHKKSPRYKDCSVDPHWHNFQNFCEDIQKLEGYAEWKADSLVKGRAKYELDKDIKITHNKVYSKNSCMLVLKEDNIREMITRTNCNLSGKTYIGIRIVDNYTEEFKNQTKFGKAHGLPQHIVSYGIKKGRTTCGSWIFKLKDI